MSDQENTFQATDVLKHRYADVEVLRSCLVAMQFKEIDIKIRATEQTGLSVNLPEKLTNVRSIFK
ncbi:hypothetical protein N0V82_010076 [Gnomoniopsis sp. IMI 355080]|nr:hypothetical protein N0V82_010076 [Gnomoniopsis sp. IMI 355080]